MDDLRFDGRVAVISGAGRGLGRSHALLLARQGCKVVVNDTGAAIKGEGSDAGPAQDVVDEIVAAGGEAVASTDSVASMEGGQTIIQTALDAFGKIDILIHNAGNVRYGSLSEISYEDFKSVVDVHLMGAFHLVRTAFPLMCAQRYGRIVLTSSIGGIYGNLNCVNYGVSKSGMIGLSNVAALEGEACNVKSNLLVPSAVTRMADGLDISQYPPMGPELVSPTVGWLAHEDCSISGEMIAAIGGRISRCYVAETVGVYRPEWTIQQVGELMPAARDIEGAHDFGLHGHLSHIGYSFQMARGEVQGRA
jgi:NAD(P)-dependent dehydrogenase (short-subunit alcohol dehydrogenase family)